MGCMKNLSGRWSLSSIPRNWKVDVLELNSGNDGKVTGKANILIDDSPLSFRVFGNYNGASVDINFISELTRSYTEIQFNFVGNCKGDNVFDGAIFGEELTGSCQMTHLA